MQNDYGCGCADQVAPAPHPCSPTALSTALASGSMPRAEPHVVPRTECHGMRKKMCPPLHPRVMVPVGYPCKCPAHTQRPAIAIGRSQLWGVARPGPWGVTTPLGWNANMLQAQQGSPHAHQLRQLPAGLPGHPAAGQGGSAARLRLLGVAGDGGGEVSCWGSQGALTP